MLTSSIILAIATVVSLTFQTVHPVTNTLAPHELASYFMHMGDRYPVKSVNEVFKDNILLTLEYMKGSVKNLPPFNWNELEKPHHYQFTLQPHENFAFHNMVLPLYAGTIS